MSMDFIIANLVVGKVKETLLLNSGTALYSISR